MRKLYPLLCALCFLWTQNATAQRIPNKWDEPPIKGVSRAWLRLFYFYQPRVWPNNDLPPNYWLNAWSQAQQLPVVEPDAPRFGIENFGSWEFMGPDSTNTGWLGRVNALVVDRTNPATVYVGESKGGVWKSTDSGTAWTNLTDTITQYVGCLVQDPINATTLYLGTGEEYFALNALGGVGIYKSTDGGATWALKGNSTFAGRRINQIVIDPGNTNKWVVSSDAGIYTTTDGGATFALRLSGTASALRMHPTNSAILYAALGLYYGAANNGIYKSTNGGVNWTLLAGGLPANATMGRIELDIHKANPNIVYVAIGSPGSPYALNYFGKTTNGGTSWTSLTLPTTAGGANRDTWYNLFVRADPADANTAYVGVVALYRTTNGGSAWTVVTPNHPDMHALEFDPNNHLNVYAGEDGGLFYSTNQGAAWTNKNNGRGVMEYYAFDVHPTDPLKLAAGAQDNSTHIRTGTNAFNVVIGGDGFWTSYKKSDPTIMLGEYQYGNISRSTNSGTNWDFVFSVPNGYWSTPIVNDPTTPSQFYTGGVAVYRSVNSGANWSAASGTLDGNAIARITVAPNNSNVVYVGTLGGGFFATANAAVTWTNRTAGLPTSAVGAIAVDPTNANTVYVGLTGNVVHRIWKSTNAGATWSVYTGNIPAAPVTGLVVNPVNTGQVLAATDVGVFLTNNGVTWARYGSGFPNTPCTHLIANAATGYLTVSTYGRGMWRILLPGNNPLPLLTSITPSSASQGSAALTLTVNGDNFIPTSQVRWNGVNRTTTYVSINQLTATIPATDLTIPGTASVTVFNPAPLGGTSAARMFTVTNAAVTFSGSTTDALKYNRVEAGQPPSNLSATATAVTYTVFQVTVPTSGSYDFEVACAYDAFTTLYSTDFNPSAALTNSLVANDDKGGMTARSGFDGIPLAAGTTYYFVVSGYENGSFGSFNGTISGPALATVTPLRFITGTVTLQGLLPAGYPQTLTFQFRPQGGGANFNRNVTVDSSGAFAVINLLPANYTVAVKGSKWLQRTTPLNVTGGNLTGTAITLLGGDATNDNTVDIADLTALIAAYNQTKPNTGYSSAADFNGDGTDDIADLLLLIGNYNLLGDP